MTIRELREALDGLPQLPSDTEVAVEKDYDATLRGVVYVEWEPEYEVVVIHVSGEVDR